MDVEKPEIDRLADEVLRRMIATPPQPKPKGRKSPEKKVEPKP